ncbi:MAG: hypothetical protein K5851_08915 [Lachnospiraceae bacterium]|nr:hypothetical protein [Lachnospiraceae bacterium]
MSGFGQDYRDEIKSAIELAAEGRNNDALDILDNLNWRKIHNISAIVQASQLYESLGKIEDAKDLLVMAHDRSPIGRVVLYNLCLLCARSGELEEAREYYDDFVDIAPHDFQKYVLKYYLAEKRGADEYTLIGILEELKNNEFIDEWAYQLAFLYHKTGQVEKCIEMCDELALYYGDGVFVQKALELKMLYQPLTSEQQDQYRAISGNVLAKEEEEEKKSAPIKREIPEPKSNPHKFDTVNLQAEIKKNIDEIMHATEAGEVNETLENIEGLVEELPYVTMPEMDAKKEDKKEDKKDDDEKSLMDHYKHFLAEEYDGQLSLAIPTESVQETQIAGQLSIEDVLSNWEKTSRAAQAALEESAQERLEKSKEEAIKKATHIIDRLEKAKPLLDAGVEPQFLMKDEILSKEEEPEVVEVAINEPKVEESEVEELEVETNILNDDWKKGATYKIPKFDDDGEENGGGFEVPIVDKDGKPEVSEENKSIEHKAEKEIKNFEPPKVTREEVEKSKKGNYQEATNIMTNVNNMLQAEIEKLSDHAKIAAEVASAVNSPIEAFIEPVKKEVDKIVSVKESSISNAIEKNEPIKVELKEAEPAKEEPAKETESVKEAEPVKEIEPEKKEGAEEDLTKLHLTEEDEVIEEKHDAFEDFKVKDTDDESLLAETLIKKNEKKVLEKENLKKAKEKENEKPSQIKEDLNKTVVLEPLDEHLADEKNADAVVESVDETVLTNVIEDEMPMQSLTEDEKELFSYFLPIPNMEKTIMGVLTGARERLLKEGVSSRGNIIITGGRGSGKTTLAKALILTLQNEIDKPGKNIGKIDAEKLNGKDLQELYSRIKGGCLVIEQAGDLLLDTEVSLSLLMNNDTEGTLVILEDNNAGIDRVLSTCAEFGKKFTERISIPVFTIDELVTFGIKYADDAGYNVDEMGRLAMYDRISKAQRSDRPLYLKDVIEIMDEAIDRTNSKGFFHRKRVDEDGRPILVEKDFL